MDDARREQERQAEREREWAADQQQRDEEAEEWRRYEADYYASQRQEAAVSHADVDDADTVALRELEDAEFRQWAAQHTEWPTREGWQAWQRSRGITHDDAVARRMATLRESRIVRTGQDAPKRCYLCYRSDVPLVCGAYQADDMALYVAVGPDYQGWKRYVAWLCRDCYATDEPYHRFLTAVREAYYPVRFVTNPKTPEEMSLALFPMEPIR